MAVPPPLPQADGLDAGPSKAALRKELRHRRAAFAAGPDAARHNAALVGRLLPLLDRATPIAGYVAYRGEPDILPILLRAHEAGIAVALPHVGEDRRMHFVAWHPEMALIPGSLGIPQPDAAGGEIVPSIVLTPLVGFDRRGHRLGQGAGYYDRWFAAHPEAMRVGIAWSVQEVPALPRDDWDMPLHIIVTEKDRIAL
jgi:5-formyltetrahydrofolate cyclo-ligase